MADDKRKPVIVIKKIYESPAGAHGGAWKVAFADFMTAMMCFFLVMWLMAQTDDVKKQVASYFTGPSVLEQNFKSYGAELTLEKLFMDIINEPLKTLQTVMEPADLTPDLLSMGSRKVVLQFIANEMGKVATNVKVEQDRVIMEIPDVDLFESGTARPSLEFTDIMTKLSVVTRGLENSDIDVESQLYNESVPTAVRKDAISVAQERADLVAANISTTLQHDTVKTSTKVHVTEFGQVIHGERPRGKLIITLKQRAMTADGRKPRPLQDMFGGKQSDMTVYDDFVRRMSDAKKAAKKSHRKE
jgi:chemotaxis protein MotB